MGKIVVYNVHDEDYTNERCNHYIGRSKSGNPLSNPFTHNGVKSNLAKMSFKTREEAIAAFETYFDLMYGKDPELTAAFDEIYKEYKAGNDIYLGCFCKPKSCHGDVLAKKLQEHLIKEKMKEKRSEK